MKIGLALSGGGFRATVFHLGVMRYLRDVGALKNVTSIVSVSGGSILAAHAVLNWANYIGTASKFTEMTDELKDYMKRDPRNRIALSLIHI